MITINITEKEFETIIEGLAELQAKKSFNTILKLNDEKQRSLAKELVKTKLPKESSTEQTK